MHSLAARLVSLLIAGVLLLQVVASFDLFPTLVSRPSSQFWPFTDYPMYRWARHEGAVIEWYRVLGRRTDGSTVEVTAADLGLNFRKFVEFVVTSVRIKDVDMARRFADLYEKRTGVAIEAFWLERHGTVLTRDGLSQAPLVQTASLELRSR